MRTAETVIYLRILPIVCFFSFYVTMKYIPGRISLRVFGLVNGEAGIEVPHDQPSYSNE
jgi:hypothetical protein